MEITQELITELRAAKSKEAFAGILAENKIELTAEEVDGWYQHESKIAEMPDDELAQVTGGFSIRTPSVFHNSQTPICDHRELGACSVPRSVCMGNPFAPAAEVAEARNAYARNCPKFVNDYQPKGFNH